MATLQRQVLEILFLRLSQSKEIDAEKVAKLKAMLTSDKKPKVDDLVKIFSTPPGGDVK